MTRTLPRTPAAALAALLLFPLPSRAEVRTERIASCTSSPLRAGAPFSAVGAHWRGSPELALELSVSPDGARWGAWVSVPREATVGETREDGTPNPLAGEAAGALVFVAPGSRWLRWRATLPRTERREAAPESVTFLLIDPGTPEPGGPELAAGAARRAAAPPLELPGADAPPARPAYVSRAEWGARPPRYGYTYTRASHVGLHHTASVADFEARTREECAARMRAIQAWHVDANGWNDIGYAWAICPHGDVFQGREDDDDATDVQGAHDGWNRGSTGVALFGYFHPPADEQPTEAQLEALTGLVAWIAGLRGFDPLGRSLYEPFGAPVDALYGHREVSATDCPGDRLFALKESLRRAASEKVLRQPL